MPVKEGITNEVLLKLVMNNIPSYIFWKDLNSIYLGCNEKFAERIGFGNAQDIVGKTEFDLNWNKEDAEAYIKADQEIIIHDRPVIGLIEEQDVGDGIMTWFKTDKYPLKDHNGEVIGVIGLVQDITKQKHLERRLMKQSSILQEQNDRLIESNKELEKLSYATSHDLQEPLRMINSYLGLIKEEVKPNINDKIANYFSFVERGMHKMSALIRDIATYSKWSTRYLQFESINIQSVINQVTAELQKDEGVIITNTVPDITVRCHLLAITRAITEVMTNGVRYNRSSVKKLNIRYLENDSSWTLAFEDNGVGIDSQFSKQIFAPFKKLNAECSYFESGLGLSVTKKIIDAHNGSISFDSTKDRGTTFYIEIPKHPELSLELS